jgi:signal transduction histidine kinase
VGLGLSIVKAIALAHGGQVTAGNQDSGGAIVRIELPGSADAPTTNAATAGGDVS